MKIKTIIIDDEMLAVAELQDMLKNHEEIEVVEICYGADEGIEKVLRLQPHLIFLDVNMPDKNGFDLLTNLDEVPEVIFVTAYDQFAINAFDINALDYILKPINPDRLAMAIAKMVRKFNQVQNVSSLDRLTINKRIFIKDDEQCFFVPLSEVFLIESVGNYARIYYQDKKLLLHKSLNYLESKFPEEFFFRASRQQIFNISFVKAIVPYFSNTLQVELQKGPKVNLSQRQSIKFREIMGI